MKIAITTPTGHIGGKLADLLLAEGGHEVVLLARFPEKVEHLRERGATVIRADLADAGSLTAATVGVDALFFLCPPNVAAPDYLRYYATISAHGAEAVARNQIPHTVMLSAVGAHLPSGTGLVLGLRDGERIFREAAARGAGPPLGLTFLRSTLCMELYLEQTNSIRLMRSVFLPMSGDLGVSLVSTVDLADRAARALTAAPPEQTAVISVHGPKDYRLDDCARIISESVGKRIEHVQIAPIQFKALMIGGGAGASAAEKMVEMYAWIQSGTERDEVERSPETTTPTTFETFVERELAPALRA